MSLSLSQIYLHIVYSAKHRKPFLKGDSLLSEVHCLSGDNGRKPRLPGPHCGGHGRPRSSALPVWPQHHRPLTSSAIKSGPALLGSRRNLD